MNKQSWKLINIIATGIFVTVLFSLVLFWGRLFCNFKLIKNIPQSSVAILIRPSGLVAGEPYPQQVKPPEEYRVQSAPPGPNEPNFRYSQVSVSIYRADILINSFGAFSDVWAEMQQSRDVNERVYYRFDDENNFICFDKTSGLIIEHHALKQGSLKEEHITRRIELFAGPNGVSKTPDLSLGRFSAPIASGGRWSLSDYNHLGFYDEVERRFYVIDFVKGSVDKGLQLEKGDGREPIEAGVIDKSFCSGDNWWNAYIGWSPPEIWKPIGDMNISLAEQAGGTPPGTWKPQKAILPGNSQSSEGYVYCSLFDWTYTFIPVLDKTGRIYIYNSKEQSLTQCGYVPAPPSLFNVKTQNETANLRDMLGYQVWPVYAMLRSPSALKQPGKVIDVKYLGMCVGAMSREGTSLTAAVFDPNGKLVYRGETRARDGRSSAEAVYDEAPGSSFWTAILFMLENLQPVAFELTSYLCGDCIEAGAGHRALFILPNSFVGMLGRGTDGELATRPFVALWLMGPSLILSVWLALGIRKDAILVGLSSTAKKWWIIGTIAFGLPAYITYRLTRPKETLVSCQNCGKMRRPDMETCHHCGSKWEVPELTPPNWRICD